jgi:hypothetical protein
MGLDEPILSFRRRFNGLDEIISYNDYTTMLCKIYYVRFCGGISLNGFHIKIVTN